MAKLCENYDQALGQNGSSEDAISGHPSSCSSLPVTPATDNFDTFVGTGPTTRPASAAPNDRAATDEVLRLKLELAKAQNHISRVEQELVHTRREQQDSGRATPIMSSDSDFVGGAPLVDPIGSKPSGNSSLSGFPKPQFSQANNWQGPVPDDCRSDVSDPLSATGFNNRARGIWNNNGGKTGYQNSFAPPPQPIPMQDAVQVGNWSQPRNQGFMEQNISSYPAPAMDGYRGDRYSQEPDLSRAGNGRRGSRYDNRYGGQSYGSGYGGYNMGGMGQSQYDAASSYGGGPPSSMSGGSMAMFPQYGQPVGTPLSPHATEFTSASVSSWKPEVSSHPSARHEPDLVADFCQPRLDYRHRRPNIPPNYRASELPPPSGP